MFLCQLCEYQRCCCSQKPNSFLFLHRFSTGTTSLARLNFLDGGPHSTIIDRHHQSFTSTSNELRAPVLESLGSHSHLHSMLFSSRHMIGLVLISCGLLLARTADCFATPSSRRPLLDHSPRRSTSRFNSNNAQDSESIAIAATSSNDWDGQVVSNAVDGKIGGCSVQPVDGSEVEWILTIDGVQADLGRFSEAIFKKIVADAKQQRFQGFKPGTIPPHLEPTYRTFAMDECARETVLEAMQQNNIRPFESCRQDMILESFSIPKAAAKSAKKKSSKKKRQSSAADDDSPMVEPVIKPADEWRVFATMKEAIDAGWRPGQSFSFVARGIKGQVVKDDASAIPLGISRR